MVSSVLNTEKVRLQGGVLGERILDFPELSCCFFLPKGVENQFHTPPAFFQGRVMQKLRWQKQLYPHFGKKESNDLASNS